MISQHVLAGLVVGVMAVVAGVGSVTLALLTRRRRQEIAATYTSTGGVVYSALQFGCGGFLILLGLGLIGVVLVARG